MKFIRPLRIFYKEEKIDDIKYGVFKIHKYDISDFIKVLQDAEERQKQMKEAGEEVPEYYCILNNLKAAGALSGL